MQIKSDLEEEWRKINGKKIRNNSCLCNQNVLLWIHGHVSNRINT